MRSAKSSNMYNFSAQKKFVSKVSHDSHQQVKFSIFGTIGGRLVALAKSKLLTT